VADHLTEEEQIDALKSWWKEYWKSIVLPIGAAVAVYFGWNQWSEQQLANAEAGGAKYEELVKSMETAPGQSLSAEQVALAKVAAAELIDSFSGSLYADHANLILARLAVNEKDMAAAEGFLMAVVSGGSNKAIEDLAKGRLARVKLAKQDYDGALALVSASGDSAYKSMFAEIRGDALAGQGNVLAAKTAFQEAIDNLAGDQFSRRSIIQLKIDGVDILASSGQTAAPEAPIDAPTDELQSGDAESADATPAATPADAEKS